MDTTSIFKPFCAVYTVLLKNSKVLLLKRKNQEWPSGYYTLPASHIMPSESLTQATSRLIVEQTGMKIFPENVNFVHVSYRKIGERTYTDFFFSVQPTEQQEDQIMNKQPELCESMNWFELSSLPDNLLFNLKTILLDLEQAIVFREFGWSESFPVNLEE